MKLLFTSGTARGGTNFRTLMLNSHPLLRMSLDPFIPLFRNYRDSLFRANGDADVLASMSSPVLDDYYFSSTKIKAMKAIQSADPDIPFDQSVWPELKNSIASRMKLASMDLIEHLDHLPAPTFREVFQNTMKVISQTREGELAWVGFNDNWAMEFFPLIAQLIPDAKFILNLRDPRAVVYSSEYAEPDPAKRPTVVSFARHLRKYFAYSQMLPKLSPLAERLMITRYEPFVADPESELRAICEFLSVDYISEMTDVSRFRKADGSQWPSDWSIYQSSTDIWRKEMPRDMAELTEFVCDPEMQLQGYVPEIYDRKKGLSSEAFNYAVDNCITCLGWRTDFQEIERTLGSEMFRKRLIAEGTEIGIDEIERNFLFETVYQRVRQLAH